MSHYGTHPQWGKGWNVGYKEGREASAAKIAALESKLAKLQPLFAAAETTVRELGNWLTDNTENVFEEQPEIDGIRAELHDAIEAFRKGEAAADTRPPLNEWQKIAARAYCQDTAHIADDPNPWPLVDDYDDGYFHAVMSDLDGVEDDEDAYNRIEGARCDLEQVCNALALHNHKQEA